MSTHFDPNYVDDRDVCYLTTIQPGEVYQIANEIDHPIRVYTQKTGKLDMPPGPMVVLQTTKGTEPSAR